jgi:hypothetical protein
MNEVADWEGAKVQDVVDALEGSAGDEGGDPIGNGVLVTNHEVLVLRRLMRSSSK